MTKIVKLAIFLFLVVNIRAFTQSIIELDSLQLSLKNATSDTARYSALKAISKLYVKTNYLKAMDYAQRAHDFAREKKLRSQEADATMQMGSIALYQGDYRTASRHYFEAISYYEISADTTQYISACNNLGATFDRLKEFDNALLYYFKAQQLLNRQPDSGRKRNIAPTLHNNIANIYQTKGDIPAALQYYKKALELANLVPGHPVQGVANNNIGKLYLVDLKQPEEALAYLQKGLEVREQIGNVGEVAKSLIVLSEYYFQQKHFSEALAFAQRALEIGEDTGSREIQMDGHTMISKAYEGQGRYELALTEFRQATSLRDSIQSQAAKSEIARLQLQYDFDKLAKERQLEHEQSRLRYIITIIVLSACLLLAVAIALIVRARSRHHELLRKSLAQDVELKNKELTTNVMYLIRKNELINSVAERLLKVEAKQLPDNQKTIHEIVLELQREADGDTWREFELRFNQVHLDFYSKLRSLYPDLTPADEKLCALLRLNMSSKEIAAITQQSIKSVEVARARLRKKLNLTNTSSNLVTHLSNL